MIHPIHLFSFFVLIVPIFFWCLSISQWFWLVFFYFYSSSPNFPLFVRFFLIIIHRCTGLLHSHWQLALALVLCHFNVTASFLCLLMCKWISVFCIVIHSTWVSYPKVSLNFKSYSSSVSELVYWWLWIVHSRPKAGFETYLYVILITSLPSYYHLLQIIECHNKVNTNQQV